MGLPHRSWFTAIGQKYVLGLALAGALSLWNSVQAHSAEKVKVAAAFGTIWTSAQPAFCRDRGEFAKAGLDVEIFTTRGGSETVQAVITGGTDIGYGPGINAVIAASLQGAKIKVVAGYFKGQNDSFFYVPVDSPIKTIDDINNKSVAFSRPGSVSEQILLALKNERHLNFTAVSAGGLDTTFTMTMTRQVDVGYSIPPAVLDVVEKGQVRVVFTGDVVPSLRNITSRVTIARDDFINTRRPVATKFIQVLNGCIDWMYANPAPAAKMFGALNHVSDAIATRAISFYPREAMVFAPIAGFQESIQDALDNKFIDKMPTEAQIKNMMDLIDVQRQ
jgi:NitT/TauT family transport system substrate-binding protein